MADFYRVQIESIDDKCLTCRVTELYGQGYHLDSSLTLVLGFLWDTVWEHGLVCRLGRTSPLGQELAERDFCDEDWNLENAERFISCFGVVDRGECDYQYLGSEEPDKLPQATYNIAVTDQQWIEHLSAGLEWYSRVWNQDWVLSFDPAWRTPDVAMIAKSIDESQDFSSLPVLADALQEAGCNKTYLLNHFRDPHATHVRGCWALDLVLGRELAPDDGEDDGE